MPLSASGARYRSKIVVDEESVRLVTNQPYYVRDGQPVGILPLIITARVHSGMDHRFSNTIRSRRGKSQEIADFVFVHIMHERHYRDRIQPYPLAVISCREFGFNKVATAT